MSLLLESAGRPFQRRLFLLRLAGAGVAIPSLLGWGRSTRANEGGAGRARPSARDFESLEDPRFRIREDDGSLGEFVLSEVRRARRGRGPAPQGSVVDSFSVLFRPTAPRALRQDVREVIHPKLGTLRLLLVPVGPFQGEARYEAVFS